MVTDGPVESLVLRVEARGEWTLVRASGYLDIGTAEEFRRRLFGLVSAGQVRIALDVSGLVWCDRTGFGCFIAVLKRARTVGGDLILLRPTAYIQRVLTSMGLSEHVSSLDQLPE
jgi:anti-sigma B factor antagonist